MNIERLENAEVQRAVMAGVTALSRRETNPLVIAAGAGIESAALAIEVARFGYTAIFRYLPDSAWRFFDGLSSEIAGTWSDPARFGDAIAAFKEVRRELCGAAARIASNPHSTMDDADRLNHAMAAFAALWAALIIRALELKGGIRARLRDEFIARRAEGEKPEAAATTIASDDAVASVESTKPAETGV